MQLANNRRKRIILAVIGVLMLQSASLFFNRADAAGLTFTYLRLNRMKANTSTSLRVVFKTPAASSGVVAKVKIKLTHANDPDQTVANNLFTINTTQTASSASCAAETGATALPGTLAATGDNTWTGPATAPTGKTITVTGVTALAVSTSYCVDLTSATAITNPVNTGQFLANVATTTSADVAVDNLDIGTRIITDDQIVVTAVVPPSFNLVLSGNTDAFTTLLDPSAIVSTGGRTATITTNAAHGWIAWVKDLNAGLSSAAAPYTIPTAGVLDATPSTLVAGTEGYVLDTKLTTDAAGGGVVTIDPEYNGAGVVQGGTLSNTIFQKIATANGTANGDVITLIERAAISASTPAGNDYTDTLTLIAAGNF